MKKFEFNLDKVLTYKEQMLDSEMMRLGELNNTLEMCNQELICLKQQQDRCREELDLQIKGKTTTYACNTYLSYGQALKEQIYLKQKQIQQLTIKINKQMELIKELKAGSRSLELIRDQRYRQYVKEELKAEENSIEEFVSTARIMATGN